jgi:transcriptional regulator with XRE-family HTH domain
MKSPRENKMGKIHRMTDQTRRNFAIRLTTLRKQRFSNADEFAGLIGIQAQRYRKWEQGKAEPSFAYLLRVCQLLNCTPNYLLLGFFDRYEELPRVQKPVEIKPRKSRKKPGTIKRA